ncbi:hypothetical protein [Pseudaminobacter soli (ex Zhang et al. 2022)]|uniref:hypothetical protein n=1 Tax=Pseudaminobacter soli (ex Zhang et al. 2022) TaxID=2831468 RepID=UPI001AEDAAD0|nr:hypothetical protein [Pseudaminobacter soli]
MTAHPKMITFTVDDPKSLLAKLYGSRKAIREEGESYPFKIVDLNERWRVILCKDGIQWILQKRGGLDKGEARWRGMAYYRTKAGLLNRIRREGVELTSDAMAVLAALPERL